MLFLGYSLSGAEQSRHNFLVLRPTTPLIYWVLMRRTFVHENAAATNWALDLTLDLWLVKGLIRRNNFGSFKFTLLVLLFSPFLKMLLFIYYDEVGLLITKIRVHNRLIVYFIYSIYFMCLYNCSLFHKAGISTNRTPNRTSKESSFIIECCCGCSYNLLDFYSTRWFRKGLSIHSTCKTSFPWALWFIKTFNVIL